jgi:hypothetical protein
MSFHLAGTLHRKRNAIKHVHGGPRSGSATIGRGDAQRRESRGLQAPSHALPAARGVSHGRGPRPDASGSGASPLPSREHGRVSRLASPCRVTVLPISVRV